MYTTEYCLGSGLEPDWEGSSPEFQSHRERSGSLPPRKEAMYIIMHISNYRVKGVLDPQGNYNV